MFVSIRTQNLSTFVFLVEAGLGNLPYIYIYIYIYNVWAHLGGAASRHSYRRLRKKHSSGEEERLLLREGPKSTTTTIYLSIYLSIIYLSTYLSIYASMYISIYRPLIGSILLGAEQLDARGHLGGRGWVRAARVDLAARPGGGST